jgi:hypothetical protein
VRYFARYFVRYVVRYLKRYFVRYVVRYLVRYVPRAQCIHGGPAGCADAVRPALPRAPLPVVGLFLFRLD